MAVVTCEACDSDNLVRTGDAGGVISLACQACGHEFSRTPRPVCPRCGSGDVTTGSYEGWAYDNLEVARDAGFTGSDASWEYVDRLVFRCTKCHQEWKGVEATRRPPQPPEGTATS
jgi:Zn finger protein HypA/HybF involved in hydrogenase expression